MSKIIRSNKVNLAEGAYKLSQDVFLNKEFYVSHSEQANGKAAPISDAENKEEEYGPDLLIEKAESAALEIMDNAQVYADDLIAEARASARELKDEAVKNAELIYEDRKRKGYDEGYLAGYQEGLTQGGREAEAIIEKANLEYEGAIALKRELQNKAKNLYVESESELIKLVLAITKKVIGKEIEELDYIESLIAEAMSHLNYATDIVIRVSEHDYATANRARPKILAMAERIDKLEIKIDYALPPGTCVIDTDTGSIDSSIETQLEGIEALFDEILLANESEREAFEKEDSEFSDSENQPDFKEPEGSEF